MSLFEVRPHDEVAMFGAPPGALLLPRTYVRSVTDRGKQTYEVRVNGKYIGRKADISEAIRIRDKALTTILEKKLSDPTGPYEDFSFVKPRLERNRIVWVLNIPARYLGEEPTEFPTIQEAFAERQRQISWFRPNPVNYERVSDVVKKLFKRTDPKPATLVRIAPRPSPEEDHTSYMDPEDVPVEPVQFTPPAINTPIRSDLCGEALRKIKTARTLNEAGMYNPVRRLLLRKLEKGKTRVKVLKFASLLRSLGSDGDHPMSEAVRSFVIKRLLKKCPETGEDSNHFLSGIIDPQPDPYDDASYFLDPDHGEDYLSKLAMTGANISNMRL